VDLHDRVALVTGGAHRLGRAFSLGLARAGADVIVNYHTSEAEAEETAATIRSLGRRVVTVRADVSTAAGVGRLVDATRHAFGRLDILVNSASLFERQPVLEITEADWDRVLGVNLKGPFFLAQAAVPLLSEHGGVIVNIADLSALQAWPTFAHHAVSKAGLVHLTRILARALAPRIRVNALVPGTVLPPSGYEGEDWVCGRDRRVVEREGAPEDVANALLYLIGAGFVTGQCMVVDGGRMLL
jgi:NAD(P)-dependent dehydrogenase (short-subunit alcohol dehydrogenase family)